jgi:hypothetical protein
MAASTPAEKKYLSKEEYLDILDRQHEKLRSTNSEMASLPAFQPASYAPGYEYILECRAHLDASGNERFDKAMGRYMEPGQDAAAFDEARAECMALLEGRPDLQKRWDEQYGADMWKKVQEALKEAGKLKVEA